jgi:hypothetical protein
MSLLVIGVVLSVWKQIKPEDQYRQGTVGVLHNHKLLTLYLIKYSYRLYKSSEYQFQNSVSYILLGITSCTVSHSVNKL